MKARQFRRRQEGGAKRPRGAHARAADRGGFARTATLCGEPHPHAECPATCHKYKGHIGKHAGYVIEGIKDKVTGRAVARKRIEVQWSDDEAKQWKAAEEAGEDVAKVRSADGREWSEDKILPAGG